MSTVVRSSTPPAEYEPVTPQTKDNTNIEQNFDDIEPIADIDSGNLVLDALNIEENYESIPSDNIGNLDEIGEYIKTLIDKKGIKPTRDSFKKVLDGLKEDMGLSEESTPETIIDRIGGVVKAWKEISFINDPAEKRRLFMKLAKLPSSKDMNKLVFEEMERVKIWQ